MAAPPTYPVPRPATLHAADPLCFWHLASLDAPTVAVIWCLAFAWAAGVALPLWVPVVLALAGWSFYLLDRLFDARRCLGRPKSARLSQRSPSPLRPRHYFHWQHRRIFVPAAIGAAVLALGIVLGSMPAVARGRNSVLAVAAVAYFTSVHHPWTTGTSRFKFPKELLVGVLFTLACAMPAFTRMASRQDTLLTPLWIYMALAWLNCAAIESWESSTESSPWIFRAALALAAAASVSAAAYFAFGSPKLALLLAAAAISAALLALLDRQGGKLAPTTLRAAADLVLLTPFVLLLLP